VVLALVLVQALLVGGWWLVERGWAPAAELTPADRPAPTLSYLRRDGSPATLGAADEPVVVHFWATWCPPCREELPMLVRWSERTGHRLLAVTVDPEWSEVHGFFDGAPPQSVVRAAPEEARSWGADQLPATFVVEGGRITREARGAVDWRRIELR